MRTLCVAAARTLALALCVISAVSTQPGAQPAPRRARSAAAQWLTPPLAVHVGAVGGSGGTDGQWQPTPVHVEGARGVSSPVQLLVLLVSPPAPTAPAAPAAPAQCQVNAAPAPAPAPNLILTSAPAPATAHVSAPATAHAPATDRVSAPATAHAPAPAPFGLRIPEDEYPRIPSPSTGSTPRTRPAAAPHPPLAERRARNAPNFLPVENSQLLLQQFREQSARTPSLPPVVVEPLATNTDDEVVDVPEAAEPAPAPAPTGGPSHGQHEDTERCRRACRQKSRPQLPAGGGGGGYPAHSASPATESPPLPRFDRSMMLQAVLTVYSADYSEPYTVWWDAASGSSRVDYHGATTSTYRMMRLDGRVHSVQVRLDRTGEADVRRCVALAPRRVSLAERALPALPDLTGFSFAGYVEVPPSAGDVPMRVERWRQTVTGAAGEAAEGGEVLTYRHELLVARAPDNYTTTPLRYAVAVDSSVLGDNCDSYAHRYHKVQTRHLDPAMFRLDIGDACDQIETTDVIDLVEPLREFTMLQRDTKYDSEHQRFKRLYTRRYADKLEETVRKSVLMQTSRFVSSGNRKGASFELEVNFLADRLQVERQRLLGAEEQPKVMSEPFPHSDEELRGLRGRLPKTFDWRIRGGVTSVRYQAECNSCWAFSVVGAVEGALFVNTGRLVPLSEQSLVDCGKRYGTNGCNGTWPKFAFDYVKQQGLPALDEYPSYQAKVQQCSADSVPAVTRISGYVDVPVSIVALKVAIRRHGPTVVLLDATPTSFAAYKGGYYYDAKCKKTSSNHAMLAVGWTVHRGETYFILKNWWSTAWGEDGYMRMRAATNTCGVLRRPSYPHLRSGDVLRIPATAPASVTPPAPAPAVAR